jgi:hypothetical protein
MTRTGLVRLFFGACEAVALYFFARLVWPLSSSWVHTALIIGMFSLWGRLLSSMD